MPYSTVENVRISSTGPATPVGSADRLGSAAVEAPTRPLVPRRANQALKAAMIGVRLILESLPRFGTACPVSA